MHHRRQGGSRVSIETVADEDATEQDGALLARVEDLHLQFDTKRGVVKALDGVSFDVYEGEVISLVGETGCGKTITARSFMQLVPTPPGHYPEGRIMFRTETRCDVCEGDGCQTCYDTGARFENLLEKSQEEMQHLRGNRISMVFQDPQTALNPSLTIRTQLAEAILAHQGEAVLRDAGVDVDALDPFSEVIIRKRASATRSVFQRLLSEVPPLRKHSKAIAEEVRQRSIEILHETQLPNARDVLDDYPHELSGGQQQRVMIAIALVSKPDLLIADEATTALDVTTQARIIDLLRDLQSEYNTGILYITHDLTLVEQLSDRIAVMYAGQIAELGDVETVYEDPHHPYTVGLFESIPQEATVGNRLQGITGTIPDLTNPPSGCRFCTRCPEELEHCSSERPEMVQVEADHEVACHLYPPSEFEGGDGR